MQDRGEDLASLGQVGRLPAGGDAWAGLQQSLGIRRGAHTGLEKGLQARKNMMGEVGTQQGKSISLKVLASAEPVRAPLFTRAWVWSFQ